MALSSLNFVFLKLFHFVVCKRNNSNKQLNCRKSLKMFLDNELSYLHNDFALLFVASVGTILLTTVCLYPCPKPLKPQKI